MITYDYALLQAANLRVSYADHDMQRIVEHVVSLTDIGNAKDIILALCMTAEFPTEYFRMLLQENSGIVEE